jgi:hypothetical protein
MQACTSQAVPARAPAFVPDGAPGMRSIFYIQVHLLPLLHCPYAAVVLHTTHLLGSQVQPLPQLQTTSGVAGQQR